MMTRVVNLKKEPFDVYIGRAGQGQDGYFGNPFRVVNYHNMAERTRVLKQYADHFYERLNTDPEFRKRIWELKGKTLGCFCKPFPCHGDVIAAYLEGSDGVQ